MSNRSSIAVSRRTALTGLGASGLGIALASTALPAAAQEATSEMANHPIVGAWFIPGDPSNPDDVMFATYNPNGTSVGIHPIAGTSIGIWRATGASTGEMLTKGINNSFEAGQYRRGINSEWVTFEVDAEGMTFTGQTTVVLTEHDGTYFAGFEASISGKRLEFEPVPSPDGPASTPAT